MVNYGVTNSGFVRKTHSAISDSLDDRLRTLFGDDVDVSPGSPLKVMADLFSVELLKLWVELENTYDSGFISTASNGSLESIGKMLGIDRNTGTPAAGEITFKRTTPLPSGSPQIIPSNTVVETSEIVPSQFTTTQSVYFYPEISDEEYLPVSSITEYDTANIIYSISDITVSGSTHDWLSGATFETRTIALDDTVPSGSLIKTTYNPISVTADIQSLDNDASGNVNANTITVMSDVIEFVHSVTNEDGVDGGVNSEIDSSLRNRIINASQSIGAATENAIEYALRELDGVTNVVIESPWIDNDTDTFTASDGLTSVTVSEIPVDSINSISGSVTGAFTVGSFEPETGVLNFTPGASGGETITADYDYQKIGEIKIYITGGTVGDEETEDTIVYTIEENRSAGIKSIGYGTSDPNAEGSETAKFSWFYRPVTNDINITISLIFDNDSELSNTEKDALTVVIADEINDHINNLDMGDYLYKSKILQLAISENTDIISATLDSWSIEGTPQSTSNDYINVTDTEVMQADTITVTY